MNRIWANIRILISVIMVSMLIIPYSVYSINDPEPVMRAGGSTEGPLAIMYYYSEDYEGYNIGDPIGINVTAAVPPPGIPSGSLLPAQTTGNVCAHLQLIGGYHVNVVTSAPTHAFAGGWVYKANVERFDLLLYDLAGPATMLEIALQDDNNVYHWPGGAYTQIPGLTWNLNTWYELFVEYNETAFTYSVWWDGVEYAQGSAMIGGSNMDALAWFGSDPTDAYIDNVHHWEDVLPVHNIDTDMYYPTIQLAINNLNTQDGHTIEVMPGAYYENVLVHKSITLIGEDMNTTIIDGGGMGGVVEVTADWVNITGFTVQNSGSSLAGIQLSSSCTCSTVNNNIIRNCNYGVYSDFSTFNNIIGNRIINNTYGIFIDHNGNHKIVSNTIQANDNGIYLSSSWFNDIYHNDILNNSLQAYDNIGGGNAWDDGYPSGGNYWSDYGGSDVFSGPLQNIPGSDGLGDTPYHFDFANDNYPLMYSYVLDPKVNISKWAPATATQSDVITYWINYSIEGNFAYNTVITESYPPGVTFISSTPLPDVGNNTWMLGDLAPGANDSIMITVMVGSNVPNATLLVNNVLIDYQNSTGAPRQKWAEASTLIIGVAVDLTSPDGGEFWMGGSSQMIRWDMTDDDPISDLTVDIIYSTDGGSTFPFTIATALTGYTANPCTYNWDPVALIDTLSVKIRIMVTDTSLNTAQDQSQENFTIDSTVPAAATNVRAELTAPNHVTIYWDASGSSDVDHYEIYYRLNGWDTTGDTYSLLADTGMATSYQHNNTGVNNPSSYSWQIRTFDIVGHETKTLFQAQKFGSTLSTFANPSGWFLLGNHLELINTTVEYVVQSLMPNVDHVMLYRNGEWLHWASYWPPSLNTLKDIYQGEGFWAHLTASDRFCQAGRVTDLAIPLKAGWNCVAYPFAERTMSTADIMIHLTMNCPTYTPPIYIMDPSAPYGIIPATGAEILGHGSAFWVRVTADCTWTVMNY